MLVNITDPDDSESHFVRVEETHVGKGVFAERSYPATAIVGEIKGRLVTGDQVTTEYTFDFENDLQLEPASPFRYVNHSCEPNCEFEIVDLPVEGNNVNRRAMYLIALENILPGQQFTISYNWPASAAIECHCGSDNCIGWIVCESELDQVMDAIEEQEDYDDQSEDYDDQFELQGPIESQELDEEPEASWTENCQPSN